MDRQERRLGDGAFPSKVHVDTTSGDDISPCKASMEDVAADHSYCKRNENVSSEMSASVTEQRLRIGSGICRVTISRRQTLGEAVAGETIGEAVADETIGEAVAGHTIGETVAGQTIGGAVTDNSKSLQPRFKENALAIIHGDDFLTTEEAKNIKVRSDTETTFHHNLPDNSQVLLTASGSTQYNNSVSKVPSPPAIMETIEDAVDECTEKFVGAPSDEDSDKDEELSSLVPSICLSPNSEELVEQLLQDGDW